VLDKIVNNSINALKKAQSVAGGTGRQRTGAKIIGIANDDISHLSQKSDLSIFSPARGGPLLGQNAVARIIQLNLLDTLFIALIMQDYQGAKEKLERCIEIVKPLHGK